MRGVRGPGGVRLAAVVCCAAACGGGDHVDVVYAGSLAAVVERDLGPVFEAATGIALRGEPRGSVAGANLIRDGVRSADVYITADPGTLERLGDRWEGWALRFARGELAIAYGERSRFRPALDSAACGELAWHAVLRRPGFRLGRTDPELDPKGYRTLWAFELAAAHYGQPWLADWLSSRDEGGEVFPEAQLAARVETGTVDAGAFYLAEAGAHGLRVIRLPPAVHQGDPGLAGRYARLEWRAPDGTVRRGAPIVYAVTIPADARRPEAARRFVRHLISGEGAGRLRAAGFPAARGAIGDPTRIPAELRDLAEPRGADAAATPAGESAP